VWRPALPGTECSRARAWVSLRLDGQLSSIESVLAGAHLARCADCREFAATATAVTEQLRAAPLETPALSFRPSRRPRRAGHALQAVAAAAVAAIVALSLSTSHRASHPRADLRVLDLKERQLTELDSAGKRQSGGRQQLIAIASASRAALQAPDGRSASLDGAGAGISRGEVAIRRG